MNKEKFYSTTLKKDVERVSKRKAKTLFLAGVTVFMTSANMRFDNVWQHPCPISKDESYTDNFDHLVCDFEWYNCDNERGRYAKFYV